MLTNILVFVACPSERGAVKLEERKCNIAPAFAANCIKLMVQIVSMSRFIYTIQHLSSRNLTQNWDAAPYFNALEKLEFIVENISTNYSNQGNCKIRENFQAFHTVRSCSLSLLFIPTKCTQYIKYIYSSPFTSYMFRCLLHHLQAHHSVNCSVSVCFLQRCHTVHNILFF